VSGGGLGFANSKFRVVSASARFSVSEPRFGLVPDGPALHMLSVASQRRKLPLAAYLALTGQPLSSDDMLILGIATHQVGDDTVPDALLQHLGAVSHDLDEALLNEALELVSNHHPGTTLDDATIQFLTDSGKQPDDYNGDVDAFTKEQSDSMIECFLDASVEESWRRLESKTCGWSKAALEGMKQCPPLALLATKRLVDQVAGLSEDDASLLASRVAGRLVMAEPFDKLVREGALPETRLKDFADIHPDQVAALFEP
jgi:enoyl-CoA hydratase/carnithine racemase